MAANRLILSLRSYHASTAPTMDIIPADSRPFLRTPRRMRRNSWIGTSSFELYDDLDVGLATYKSDAFELHGQLVGNGKVRNSSGIAAVRIGGV